MAPEEGEVRSLAMTPTWSVATVLTVLVGISLVVERSIHRLSNWLHASKRKALFHALGTMKEELMLLGFLSLMLTATSSSISHICIPSKYYKSIFYPCSAPQSEHAESGNGAEAHARKLLGLVFSTGGTSRRVLSGAVTNSCKEGEEPFVSLEGLEQLHRFIFVMAVTHIFYSCLTMLLAVLKILTWRNWENEAHADNHVNLKEVSRRMTLRRQSTFVKYHTSTAWSRNRFLVWVVCFLRQFGQTVTQADYITLRMGFVTNHNLTFKYDFHSYMIRSMEDEFKQIVGISAPLWGFVIVFMLFNVHGTNLYFWISFVPIILILVVGAKLQHIIATLALESVGLAESPGVKVKPRDELFWFSKPELLLSLIHFILFENAFELASFFWVWWQFGFDSCFIYHHIFVYVRLVLGFVVQFLCSYSTLPLYALVTQMGTNFKATLISTKIRESIHGWGKEAKKKRRLGGTADGTTTDDSTVRSTERSTVDSSEGSLKNSSNGHHRDRPNTNEDHIQGHHSMNVPGEIEMQYGTSTNMASNEAPLLGTVSTYRSVSSMSSQPLETRQKASNFIRSFTQPQQRQ